MMSSIVPANVMKEPTVDVLAFVWVAWPRWYNLDRECVNTSMWFCPLDGTLLHVEVANSQMKSYFYCSTCPYSCPIQNRLTVESSPLHTDRKSNQDILGGASAWEHVDRTMATCPKCQHGEAYFMQMQIRSADEPMSIFYKCCKCSHQWNDR